MSVAQGEGDGHRFGITHLDFFPFDRDAFLSSSYDGTLRLWSTGFSPNGGSPKLAGKFVVDGDHALTAHGGAGGKVYTFALSPVGHHLLVACGTQQPAVRLVDLRSGSAVQSLLMSSSTASTASGSTSTSLTSTAGTAKRADTGAVLSLAWHPSREHVLAGGSVDGAVRIWDVRRAGRGSVLGLLDAEDAVGPFGRRCGYAGGGTNHGGSGIPTRLSAKAHRGPVNSLTWTDDGAGRFLVSSGHDEARLRVWDAATGANTLAAFSPRVRNPPRLATLHPVALSHGADSPGDILLWPNDNGELLFVDVHEGTVVGSLRVPGGHLSSVPRPSDNSNNYVTSGTARHAGKHIAGGRRDADASRELTHASPRRVTAVAWRGGGGGGTSLHGPVLGGTNGPGGAIYTAHADGMVRYWAPRLEDDGEGGLGYDGEDRVEVDTEEKREETARKRKALDDAFRSLMGRNVTFT